MTKKATPIPKILTNYEDEGQNLKEINLRRRMGRYSAKHIKLTSRDLHVFRMIGSRGCVNFAAIHRNFWDGRKEETCNARIDQLVRGGYLHREITDIRGKPETIFYLGRKALSEFIEKEKKYFYKKRPASTELRHVLEMGDVLDSFTSKEVASKNEHQLKGEKALTGQIRTFEVPDREVTLENEVGERTTFYIEIDGAYHGSRLKQKIDALQQVQYPVLWVAKSAGRLNNLVAATRDHTNIRPVLFEDLKRI